MPGSWCHQYTHLKWAEFFNRVNEQKKSGRDYVKMDEKGRESIKTLGVKNLKDCMTLWMG